jgi:flagellar hook-associated protein 2
MFPGLAGESQVELNVGSGAEQKTFSFKVDSTTTLTSLATEINKVASGKLQAAVINAGTSQSPQYLLTITSTSQGTQKGLLEINVGAEIQAEGGFSSFQMSQAEDAKINIEGVGDIVRSSNQINDVIPGVSLDLKRAGTGPIIVSVQNDADKTVAKFGEVVAALNDLITYSKENSKIEQTQDSKGIKNIYGSLAKTRVDDQAIESIKGAIFGARVTDSNSELRILADLGLTIERAGTYAFDEEKLKEAIGKDSNSASQIIQSFADKLGTTNGIISQYTRFQGQIHLSKIANEDSTRLSQERIDRMEANLLRQEQAMRLLFANLESRIGEMNSQGNALSSIIQSINPS